MSAAYGNLGDRMKHWERVKEMIHTLPIATVWKIFDKMLLDRESFIYRGSEFSLPNGFLNRKYLHFKAFLDRVLMNMNNGFAVYPLYPQEENLPVLDSFEKICSYGARKYPDYHVGMTSGWKNYLTLDDYGISEYYDTTAVGGDAEKTYLTYEQLFEKLWNFLHYFGGIILNAYRNSDFFVPYYEIGGTVIEKEEDRGIYSNNPFRNPYGKGIRFFFTPKISVDCKYMIYVNSLGELPSSAEASTETGIVQYPYGRNILYESDWVSGSFSSPVFEETVTYPEYSFEISQLNLCVYPKFPDFYDPETMEPIWFDEVE